MRTVWEEFGFSRTPYSVTPLQPTREDYELFTDRDSDESSEFQVAMDNIKGSVVLVCGDIGIGKTSFVNIQQYMLAEELVGHGPKLIPAFLSTSLDEENDPTSLAKNFAQVTVKNIERYCSDHKLSVPPACSEIRNWMFSHKPTTTGYSVSVALFGVGRSISVPPVSAATLETWKSILEALTDDAKTNLKVDGVVVCIENAESTTVEKLARVLMTFRDSLFSIESIWWVLTGPSGLHQLLTAQDRRVAQRIKATGIELSTLGSPEFDDVIVRRVKVYRHDERAVSPLSKTIHNLLFSAGCGEVRFTLATADRLVDLVVKKVKREVQSKVGFRAAPQIISAMLSRVLQSELIDKQIPDELAKRVLRQEVSSCIEAHRKSSSFFVKAHLIGSNQIDRTDYQLFEFESEVTFEVEFLEKFWAEGLLYRNTIDGRQAYGLKGNAYLARELGLLEVNHPEKTI